MQAREELSERKLTILHAIIQKVFGSESELSDHS